jgi:putative glycosyltransferase
VQLSVVSTLYRSAPHLREFYTRVKDACLAISLEHEIILVNDGSPDASLEVALAIRAEDSRVQVVDLSRNFGHHRAMMTGLAQAQGELVFLIDSDLEEDPELLLGFHTHLRRSSVDVVYGVQQMRQDPLINRIGAKLFYATFNLMSPYPLPANLTTTRLMTRRFVQSLLSHEEREIIIAGLWVITGYAQLPVPVTKRFKGRSSYDLPHKVAVLVDAIASFSNKPLLFVFYLGCAILILSSSYAAYLVARRILFGELLEGWLSLFVSFWVLGGLIIFCVGVLGIYLSKIFSETKRRPLTIVRHVYQGPVLETYGLTYDSQPGTPVLQPETHPTRTHSRGS